MVGDVLDPLQTNNLLVEFKTVASRDTAYNDHQRATDLFRSLLGLVVVQDPAMFAGESTVIAKPFPLSGYVARRQPGEEAGCH